MFSNKNYVLAVWKEGSFSKAAKKLYISQPSLSATIKRIEDKISAPLFNRSTNPVTLTEAGEEYIKCALEIDRTEKSFESYIIDLTSLAQGSVRLGGSSLFSSFMLPDMIFRFNKKYPHINFEVFEDSTKNLIEKLSLGDLDIVLDNAVIQDAGLTSIPYKSEMLLLAVPDYYEVNKTLKPYRLTKDDIKTGAHLKEDIKVSVKHFSSFPFILLNPENDTGRRANNIFKESKITPDVIFSLDQQVTAFNTSATGMGITFVSDTLLINSRLGENLYYYRLDSKEILRNIFFITKSTRYLPLACQKFIEFHTKGELK